MTAIVFVGPTLAPDAVAEILEAECRPPVAMGDVYRAVLDKPRAIGLIDGVFHGAASVWHKEILWAMSRGIHVFGSASMGALRAAELHSFGMRGVGRIFEAYRDGALEDDDEVAVLHGPAEAGHVAASEPMVNVRASLEKAVADGIIAMATGDRLEALAKDVFYQDRTWHGVLDLGLDQGLAGGELEALGNWLAQDRVDQKAEDARAMLAEMARFLATDPEPLAVDFGFEWTDMWDMAVDRAQVAPRAVAAAADTLSHARVVDELRLDPEAFATAAEWALLRRLALGVSARTGPGPTRSETAQAYRRFREDRGLYGRSDVERWLAANGLDEASFERLMEDEAKIAAVRAAVPLDRPLQDHLRLSGDYAGLAKRARAKQDALKELGLDDPEPADAGLAPPGLLDWYFRTRLGRPIPEDLDGFLAGLGLSTRRDLYRLLVREYLYSQQSVVSAGSER